MFDIGFGEVFVIVLAVLLLFGPEKMPEFAKMLSKGYGRVKQAQDAFKEQVGNIQKEMKFDVNLDLPKELKRDQLFTNDFPENPKENIEKKIDPEK